MTWTWIWHGPWFPAYGCWMFRWVKSGGKCLGSCVWIIWADCVILPLFLKGCCFFFFVYVHLTSCSLVSVLYCQIMSNLQATGEKKLYSVALLSGMNSVTSTGIIILIKAFKLHGALVTVIRHFFLLHLSFWCWLLLPLSPMWQWWMFWLFGPLLHFSPAHLSPGGQSHKEMFDWSEIFSWKQPLSPSCLSFCLLVCLPVCQHCCQWVKLSDFTCFAFTFLLPWKRCL